MNKNVWLLLLLGLGLLGGCASAPETPARINTGTAGLGAYLQGAVAELGGHYGTAQKAYLYTLTEDPDNLLLRQRVFQLSLLEGDIPTAVRLAKTLPDDLRNQTMPQLLLGIDALKHNNMTEAQTHLARAANLAPQLLHFAVMQDYIGLSQGQSATQVVQHLQTLQVPAAMLARRAYQVGRIDLKAGKIEDARMALEQAWQIEPGTVFSTRLLGELYERAGDEARAAEVYRTFRTRNPNVPLFAEALARIARHEKPAPFVSGVNDDIAEVLFDFGLLVWVQGADGPARQILNLSLWLSEGRDPYAVYYAALIGEFGEQSELARTRYEELLKDPRLATAAGLRLAQMDFAAGQKDEARRRLEAMLGHSGADDVTVERALADTLFAGKDFAGALRHYRVLMKNVDSLPVAQQLPLLFATGASLERLKRYDEAGTVLKKAVVIDPANAQVLNYLGYMWVEHGMNLDEAFTLLKRANALAPNDGAITDSLGWAYFMRGNTQTALGYLERAAEQEPDDATVNEHLGDVYEKLGRHTEALTQWGLALQLSDDPEQKQRVQGKLRAK